jgi:hypothetical protein
VPSLPRYCHHGRQKVSFFESKSIALIASIIVIGVGGQYALAEAFRSSAFRFHALRSRHFRNFTQQILNIGQNPLGFRK